jgi:hypothetical protein
VGGTLSFLYYPYNSSFDPAPLLFGVALLCLPFLVAFEGFYVISGRIRTRQLPLMFAFGIAGTVVSVFFTSPLMAAGPCTPGVTGSGFPLPWYLTFTQYTGLDGPPCSFSVDRTSYWEMFALFSFLFDTIFYAGLAMSRNELYRWAKGRGCQQHSDLPESPKEIA